VSTARTAGACQEFSARAKIFRVQCITDMTGVIPDDHEIPILSYCLDSGWLRCTTLSFSSFAHSAPAKARPFGSRRVLHDPCRSRWPRLADLSDWSVRLPCDVDPEDFLFLRFVGQRFYFSKTSLLLMRATSRCARILRWREYEVGAHDENSTFGHLGHELCLLSARHQEAQSRCQLGELLRHTS
jgi:hypothetical protein